MRLLWEQFPTKASYAVYLHSQHMRFGEWLSHKIAEYPGCFLGFLTLISSCEAVMLFFFFSFLLSSISFWHLKCENINIRNAILCRKGVRIRFTPSSVMAKGLGESTRAWPLSPARLALLQHSLPTPLSHPLMVLPNRFENLLMLPQPPLHNLYFPVPVFSVFSGRGGLC